MSARQLFESGRGFFVRVAQGHEGLHDVVLGAVDVSRRAQAQVAAHLAFEFQQQPFSGFFANARNLHQAPGFLQRDGLGQLGHTQSR